jgi:SAM-dependent methyltransferase
VSSFQLSSGKCLLLADGEGRNGVYMAEQGFDVVSVDSSAAGLAKAQALAKTRNVTITTIQADLADYDLGTEEWDCIVGIYCHFPPPIRAKVLAAIPGSLKPGGYFLLECYTPDQIQYKTGGPQTPELMYSKQILSEAFDSQLEVLRNEELVRDVVEGKYHTGKGAVVQFIGQKK